MAGDLYRLYRDEWAIVHTITRTGQTDATDIHTEASTYIRDTFQDETSPDVSVDVHTDQAGTFWAHIKHRRPTMKGEFTFAADAARWAEKQGWKQWVCVTRDSWHDTELRNVGRKP